MIYGENPKVSVQDKYMLTVKEASEYFGIGIKKMRRMAEDHSDEFALYMGNRYMIIRHKFEEYLINSLTAKNTENKNEKAKSK